MKQLVVTAPDEYEVREVPVPEPGPGQVRMRVDAVTTCPQWDLHLRHNEPMFVGHQFHYPYTPGQPGHEASGVVDAVGPAVSGLPVGTRISAWRDQGQDRAGCYAQFVILEAENAIRVPETLSAEATAPLELAMCVGATVLRLRQMGLLGAVRAGVTGLGPAGLVAAQMLRAEGATEVIGFDTSPARRAHALACGLSAALDPVDAEAEGLPARPAWPALDIGIDCVGAKRSVEFLMDHTRQAVALFGVQREDYTFAVRHYGLLALIGYPGHHRQAAEYAVDLLESGKLDLTCLITHRLPLERYGEGVDLLERQEAVKVCFLPWDAAC